MSSPPPGTRDMPAPAAAPSQARTTLAARLAIRLSLFFAAAASILFLTAGTWHYWQAWLFLVLVFVPSAGYVLSASSYLMVIPHASCCISIQKQPRGQNQGMEKNDTPPRTSFG